MTLALAALLLTAQPAPSEPASPDWRLLEAFRLACERVDDFDRLRPDALARGWAEMAEADDPRVERLARIGREAVAADGGALSGASFRRRLADRDLFLIVSRWQGRGGAWGNGCRLYHFEAGAELAPVMLEIWMGRPPTGVETLPGTGVKRLWEPAWRDGVTVEVNHVRADSEAARLYGLSGNILVAQAMGGF